MGRILKKISFYGIICFGFIMILFTSCSCSKPYSEGMKAELARMFKKDQELQDWDIKRLSDNKYTDSMQIEMSRVVRANCETIKKYYKECGYPGLKESGRDACVRFWLVAQHSDHDVIFQEKMLKALERQLKKKNAVVRNYAYLYDRVMKNKGKKQKYGTQLGRLTGEEKMHPIPELEFPDKVDELRKEMGLGTLKEYVDSFEN